MTVLFEDEIAELDAWLTAHLDEGPDTTSPDLAPRWNPEPYVTSPEP